MRTKTNLIFTITCILLILASSTSAEVRLTLTTGEVRYFADDIFMLKLDLAINEDAGFYGDVYLVAIDPNGTFYFAPNWKQNAKPVLENFFFPLTVDLKSALIIEQGIPNLSFPMTDKGEYIFAIGIAKPKTFDFIKIASVTTKYLGEREWFVIGNDGSIGFSAYSVIEDRNNGGYWISSACAPISDKPYSLYHYKDGVLKGYGKDQGFAHYGGVGDMVYDSQDRLWVDYEGINRYDPTEDIFVNYLPPCFRSEDDPFYGGEKRVNSIKYDPKKNALWLGTLGGLYCYKLDDESWTYYWEEDGLVSNALMAITFDKEGNIWSVGYYHYPGKLPVSGVSKFDGVNFTNYLPDDFDITSDELSADHIGVDNENCIWIASWGSPNIKPHRFIGDKWVKFTVNDGLPSESINSFFLDRFGKFWAACSQGNPSYLAQFKDGKWFPVLTEIMNMGTNSVTDIYQDSQNNYWFSGWSNGGVAIRWGSD